MSQFKKELFAKRIMKSRCISLELIRTKAILLILFGLIFTLYALIPRISWGADPTLNRKWISIAAGKSHSLGIESDGTLWAWGGNGVGQLGDNATVEKHTPVLISRDKWVSVLAKFVHSLALRSDGTLWAWGGNEAGQLGDGTTIERHSPVQIDKDNKWTSAVAGYFHTFALKSDGTLWTWGLNEYGQLGDGTTAERSTLVQIGPISLSKNLQ